MKIGYIIPRIKEHSTVEDLLRNHNRTYSSVLEDTYLSIDDLLDKIFTCIVGEPGIGKSRLIEEIKHKLPENSRHCSASSFNPKELRDEPEYCLIDALDEVDNSLFVCKLKEIIEFHRNHPKTKIILSCRKHYISSYANHFAIITSLTYIELCRLDHQKVNEVISKYCSKVTQNSIAKSSKLMELLSIPRYLLFLIEKEDKNGECRNIGDLFEYIIDESISKAIIGRDGEGNLTKDRNKIILIKRTLEKVALVMEIGRRDSISKDELYTILDGLKGNMAQMLLANFDLLFFENRILKYTNEKLQFNNSEIQEYLAAKELCRQSNIESMLYDIAVHQDLKHIYPNWFDVIPHISYSPDGTKAFISIIKLIIGYESYLENEPFESLLRYIDPSILSHQEKQDLFLLLLEHYLRVPSYIRWGSNVYNLIQHCFTKDCVFQLIRSYESLTIIQLQNIHTVLKAITESNELEDSVIKHWTAAANSFINKEDEYKMIALSLYSVVKANNNLISLSGKFNEFCKKVKDKYCEITSRILSHINIVDCWIEECYMGNPYGIQAVLRITDPNIMLYAYKHIDDANKLKMFFTPKGSLSIWYEYYLTQQFNIAQQGTEDLRLIFLNVVAGYVNSHSGYYNYNKDFQRIIITLFLNEDTGKQFVKLIEHEWDVESLMSHLDPELIDHDLIGGVDKLLHLCGFKKRIIDAILQDLTLRICEDSDKKDTISEYINRYAHTFKSKLISLGKNNRDSDSSKLVSAYQALSDQEVPIYNKYYAAEILAKNIDFLKQRDSQPFIDIVSSFLEEINLDLESIKKKTHNSFSASWGLVRFPTFVLALYQLGQTKILSIHRMAIARTLPLVRWNINDDHAIKAAYKEIIRNLNEYEKEELVAWWESREDDFINISWEDILSCIRDYGIEALSYKLGEYMQSYVEHPDIDHLLAAKSSLEMIAQGYGKWDIKQLESLFVSMKEEDENDNEGINEIKLDCNAIMIEKFQYKDAIQWRFEYLKKHIFKSVEHNSGHYRPMSKKEVEVTSSNPYMFRCFMGISDNPDLDTRMIDLFEFGLSLSKSQNTREYSNYLLKQVYFFFISTGSLSDLKHLRKMIENTDEHNIPFYISELMNQSEILFLNQNKTPISKALHIYNRCIDETYLEIRNDGDLIRYFDGIFLEVQREIQDVGIYSLLQSNDLTEDFIQRELKNTIINIGCKKGLYLRIDREVALQDNKRTDILLWYGMCKPIMIELKLLNNPEIQRQEERQEYKKKFIQYIEATQPCLSVFWVFDVHRERSNPDKFKDLKTEYLDLSNTRVVLTDCKCRSKKKTKK